MHDDNRLIHCETNVTFPSADNAKEYLYQLLRVHGAHRPDVFTFSLSDIRKSGATKQRTSS